MIYEAKLVVVSTSWEGALLMDDVTAVKWLLLQQAVDTQAFLISVGQAALQAAEPLAREATGQPVALPVPDDSKNGGPVLEFKCPHARKPVHVEVPGNAEAVKSNWMDLAVRKSALDHAKHGP
jgi:hypothetical protein